MSEKKNFYQILGIPRNASTEDIRRAYFDAARRLHPDRNLAPGDTELFIGAQEAFETLSNPKKRSAYDQTLDPEVSAPSSVQLRTLYSRMNILHLNEPQLIYALFELAPPAEAEKGTSTPPINLCLIIDRSTSMQGSSIATVQTTAIEIMRRLKPQDVLSVVAFSDRAETLISAAS